MSQGFSLEAGDIMVNGVDLLPVHCAGGRDYKPGKGKVYFKLIPEDSTEHMEHN